MTTRPCEDAEREIPYMKGYTVFNVEQIEGLPEVYYAKTVPTHDPVARIDHAEKFFGSLGAGPPFCRVGTQ
jgi:antirestriction protein ArdC